jgi:hypothetical protein
MTSPFHRRLIMLERSPAAGRLMLQVFGTVAEAEAATEVASRHGGATVIQIFTGVPRSLDTCPS